MDNKATLSIEGGKITFIDTGAKWWDNFLSVFDVISKKLRAKSATVIFDAPEVTRSLLDVIPQEELEKKYKVSILEGASSMPLKAARQILEMAKGFDIAMRVDAIEFVFYHSGKLVVMSDLQIAPNVFALMREMFPRAVVK